MNQYIVLTQQQQGHQLKNIPLSFYTVNPPNQIFQLPQIILNQDSFNQYPQSYQPQFIFNVQNAPQVLLIGCPPPTQIQDNNIKEEHTPNFQPYNQESQIPPEQEQCNQMEDKEEVKEEKGDQRQQTQPMNNDEGNKMKIQQSQQGKEIRNVILEQQINLHCQNANQNHKILKGQSFAKIMKERKKKFKKKFDHEDGMGLMGLEGGVRRDILYKTIIRDMRKFYSKDFNIVTLYSQKKRRRDGVFYFNCIQEYIATEFQELTQDIRKNELSQSFSPLFDLNDLMFFIGCLFYPKDLEAALKDECNQDQKKAFKLEKIQSKLHAHFYSFSVGQLMKLAEYKYFAYFYCYYFKSEILEGRRLENNKTMNKKLNTYKDGCNMVLHLCKQTLTKALLEYQENSILAANINMLLNLRECEIQRIPSKKTSEFEGEIDSQLNGSSLMMESSQDISLDIEEVQMVEERKRGALGNQEGFIKLKAGDNKSQ